MSPNLTSISCNRRLQTIQTIGDMYYYPSPWTPYFALPTVCYFPDPRIPVAPVVPIEYFDIAHELRAAPRMKLYGRAEFSVPRTPKVGTTTISFRLTLRKKGIYTAFLGSYPDGRSAYAQQMQIFTVDSPTGIRTGRAYAQ